MNQKPKASVVEKSNVTLNINHWKHTEKPVLYWAKTQGQRKLSIIKDGLDTRLISIVKRYGICYTLLTDDNFAEASYRVSQKLAETNCVDYNIRQCPLKTQEEENLTAEWKWSQIPVPVQQTHGATTVWVVPVASNVQRRDTTSVLGGSDEQAPLHRGTEWAMSLAWAWPRAWICVLNLSQDLVTISVLLLIKYIIVPLKFIFS